MDTIKLTVTVDEANAILAALGQQPYIQVVDLIQKIQRQGASQMEASPQGDTSISQPSGIETYTTETYAN